MQKKTFTWTLEGPCSLHIDNTPIGALSLSALRFSKTIQLPAMDGLPGLTIKKLSLPGNLNWDMDADLRMHAIKTP